MEKIKSQETALLLIDFQQEYFKENGILKVEKGNFALQNAKNILEKMREKNAKIIHIRHISKKPNDSTFNISSENVNFVDDINIKENEIVITKQRPSAFYLTELDDYLKQNNIKNIIICGLLTFMCCDTTARDAHAKGYNTYFINDGTASVSIDDIPADTIHKVTCAIQGWMFSTVTSTEDILKQI